ncbi:hypothetical protein J6590_075601 [Homalodisca vitripennis]|nr:hypothetical protein J6590_075601 [Homalodisca vitripennis]
MQIISSLADDQGETISLRWLPTAGGNKCSGPNDIVARALTLTTPPSSNLRIRAFNLNACPRNHSARPLDGCLPEGYPILTAEVVISRLTSAGRSGSCRGPQTTSSSSGVTVGEGHGLRRRKWRSAAEAGIDRGCDRCCDTVCEGQPITRYLRPRCADTRGSLHDGLAAAAYLTDQLQRFDRSFRKLRCFT